MTGDGRLIRTDPVAMGVWQRLTGLFATWRLIVLAGFTLRSLYQFSNDQMTPLGKAVHWKIGLGLLGGLTDAQIGFLKTYAEINARKVERVFRTTALVLVTVPVAAIFGLSEVDPEIWERWGFEQFETLIFVVGVWMAFCAVMMGAAWRARDLADLLEFENARRALDAAQRTAGE